jgi:DUF438 domain-containing protein
MNNTKLMAAILNSLNAPVLVADTEHITRYMNRAAVAYYEGGASLIGRSLLDCHNEASQKTMKEILAAMYEGEEERLYSEEDDRRIWMCAVRDENGELLGYYERYEPLVISQPESE